MKEKSLRKFLLIAALIYLLIPWDLIPDFLGIIGRIDDLLLLAYCLYRYHLVQTAKRAHESNASQEQVAAQNTETDPYAILGVSRSAGAEEIRAAFKREAAKYHPDKVTHLGPELQALAHERMLAIRNAYEALRDSAQ